MRIINLLFLFFCVLSAIPNADAQLRKTASIEKVKSFNVGHAVLNKTTMNGIEIYSLTLSNSSEYYRPIVLYLGASKEEMIANLKDFSSTLKSAKKGEMFDFSACGTNYQMTYHTVFFQRCFKVWEEFNSPDDYSDLFGSTIDDILKYYNVHPDDIAEDDEEKDDEEKDDDDDEDDEEQAVFSVDRKNHK